MGTIDILTGQHITIKYEPAGIAKRMLANILDYLFILIYVLALSFIFFGIIEIDTIFTSNPLTILFFILCLPIIFYNVTFEVLMNGQTPGKYLTKIRVTNVDGSTPNFVSYFLRWVLLPVDLLPYGGIGALFILFTKNHQRLGDLAAGTTVVRLASSSSNYNLENVFDEYSTDYRPVFSGLEILTDGQIRLISELLEKPIYDINATQTIDQLAVRLKEKLKIEITLDNRAFLETLVKDYNYYSAFN